MQKCTGQINWLQSRTQFAVSLSVQQVCFCSISKCASAAATTTTTIGDLRAVNKLVREILPEAV
eukprot:12880114-Prorocentrum_lima.AAC.1